MTAPFTDAENQERHGSVFMAGMDALQAVRLARQTFRRTGAIVMGHPEDRIADPLARFLLWTTAEGNKWVLPRLHHASDQVCRWMASIEAFRDEIDLGQPVSVHAGPLTPEVVALCDAFLDRREQVPS